MKQHSCCVESRFKKTCNQHGQKYSDRKGGGETSFFLPSKLNLIIEGEKIKKEVSCQGLLISIEGPRRCWKDYSFRGSFASLKRGLSSSESYDDT